MKAKIYFIFWFLVITISSSAQNDSEYTECPVKKLTTEPATGIEPISDLIISNLLQWNIKKRLITVSYTSYSYNDALQRNSKYFKTNYNYTFTQKFGVGTSLYTKHSSHTFSIMAGIRYDAYKETLEIPDSEKVSASVSSVSPDIGLLYNLKLGKKKYFFSYRMFIPLYPYPLISSYLWSAEDNLANLSFEFGLGIRLK